LFISSDKGLFIYDGKEIVQHSGKKTFCILSDPYKPELIYAGTDEGVDVFSYIQKKLTYIKTYQLDIPVRSLASDHNKNIYFGCESNGIYYLNYYNSFLLDSIQKREGLPSVIGENYVFPHSNKLLIGTDSGVYTVKKGADDRFFCEKSESFYPLTKGTEIFRAAELEGDLVANQSYENKKLNKVDRKVIYISNENGRCYINNEITNKLKDTKVNLITYDSISKTTFLCTDEGLFLINKQKEKISRSFSFFLSSVITTKKDTVIANISSKDNSSGKKFSIAYDNNQLTFVAGYNCFENKNAVEFSYYIEGSDEETFGTWSNQNVIRTTNLHEGDYIFHIKARCDLNKEELAISFPFTILPPWYRTIWAYLVYFILFVLFLIVVVKLNSKRLIEQNLKLEGIIKQRTHTIGEQVKLLEHQKKEITDSINYAQRIQQSVLPSLTEINSVYRDFFIFFQPKDIVSGDFYWFNKMNDHEFLIACADCTGHGVPGAFMSTICSEKLTEAALKTTEPAKILFDANNAIKKVLKQDAVGDGTNKDGMEIALIKYNTQTRQLIYAGANRGMWIIRANKELEETKPTKASIASFTPFNFEYEQSVHQLDHGDMVYLTSDGYADQFGGAAGKKFMAKNMKEFLKGIVGLPVSEQKDLVSQNINDWKGSYEQVDDLLVIGVKA
jgi:serine phosphatase RsbU (regulator of sigma subunit)